ncbi:uncharacterized protein LOC108625816 [Ceratina calcarata]|uniref:Uncharacterized protein LOC108625816 n=1 Tax=Ceratina calcarata TaxID=156304 RepID=A0AAJ7J074_9HYME|nr:uncharacterized protein LOC108625816 [Ceratina calcarata]
MIRIKLVKNMLQIKNKKILLQKRCALPQILSTAKYSASKKDKIDEEFDKPIKFSTSKAATFPAAYTNVGPDEPWYQAPVIGISLMIFMIYFCILREENDIDEKMVEGIPPEILEQIYGKPKPKK